ncbi:alpha/beta hydrolase [Nonomuraea sp. NPDC049709]|uniref:alpha/beta hydrolase n=1 Tax=Nonomuraea sp. NPDC049709 TaxID=3154736 RepID=UPI003427D7F9
MSHHPRLLQEAGAQHPPRHRDRRNAGPRPLADHRQRLARGLRHRPDLHQALHPSRTGTGTGTADDHHQTRPCPRRSPIRVPARALSGRHRARPGGGRQTHHCAGAWRLHRLLRAGTRSSSACSGPADRPLPRQQAARLHPRPPLSGRCRRLHRPATFREVFAADLPASTARLMATTQRPGSVARLSATSTAPAWKSIPSWYLVAGADNAIPPAAQRFMAKRAGSKTAEIAGSSHMVMLSRPDAATAPILAAYASTRT